MFDADVRPVLTDAVLHTTHPTAPTDDLTSLAAVAHQSGGDPAVFTPDLFTTTHPHDLLTLTTPIPINLAFTRDPTPTEPPTTPPPQTAPPHHHAPAQPPSPQPQTTPSSAPATP